MQLGSKPPPVSNVLTSNYWLYIAGSLDKKALYQMLGFDLAVMFVTATPGNVALSVFTNLATYAFPNLDLPDVTIGQQFFGFLSSGTEQITGFELTSDTWATAPALDNVTLGGVATQAIPEPSTHLLMLFGIVALTVLRTGHNKRSA